MYFHVNDGAYQNEVGIIREIIFFRLKGTRNLLEVLNSYLAKVKSLEELEKDILVKLFLVNPGVNTGTGGIRDGIPSPFLSSTSKLLRNKEKFMIK